MNIEDTARMSTIRLNGIPTFFLAYYIIFKLNKIVFEAPLGKEPGQIGPDAFPPLWFCLRTFTL
jgi:hypothetical protein